MRYLKNSGMMAASASAATTIGRSNRSIPALWVLPREARFFLLKRGVRALRHRAHDGDLCATGNPRRPWAWPKSPLDSVWVQGPFSGHFGCNAPGDLILSLSARASGYTGRSQRVAIVPRHPVGGIRCQFCGVPLSNSIRHSANAIERGVISSTNAALLVFRRRLETPPSPFSSACSPAAVDARRDKCY
jgi:hypothetical protein